MWLVVCVLLYAELPFLLESLSQGQSVPEDTLLSVLLDHLDSTSAVNLAGMQVSAVVSKQLCFHAHVISILTA